MRYDKKHLVCGKGEVGTAIVKVFNADYVDITGSNAEQSHYDYLHICIPYTDTFIDDVKSYQKQFSPLFTIIHSSVPVGTSRKCDALHSAIRGLHPNLYECIMTFPKFIGGENASQVADIFRRAGLKVILLDKQESSELGKLLDTEYYRTCVEFTLKADSLCQKHNVSFHEVYTLFNMTYNDGYKELGHPEYVRPVLQAIRQPIGGHCLVPNSKLIEK